MRHTNRPVELQPLELSPSLCDRAQQCVTQAIDGGSVSGPQTVSQGFGTDAHRVIARLLAPYPEHPSEAEVEYLIDRLVSPTTVQPPATYELVQGRLWSIAAGLRCFLDVQQPEILAIESTLQCRVEVLGTVPPLRVILSGRSDLALRLGGEVWLLDHKTGRTLPTAQGLALQASSLAYTVLAEHRWPGETVHLAQWRPETGDLVSVQLSASSRAPSRQVITELVYSLERRRSGEGSVPARAGEHCTWCSLRERCATYAASLGRAEGQVDPNEGDMSSS